MTTIDERKAEWAAKFLEQGHAFQMDEPDPDDGTEGPGIDWFAVSHDIHNGPRCIRCGWSCCMHCTQIESIPPCKETPQ